MTFKEYYEAVEAGKDVSGFNRELLEKYPWLEPYNVLTGDAVDDYDYSYTFLDDIPRGWAIAFGEDMLKEIQEELEKFHFVDGYRISQIKEKFGGLRWYDNGTPVGKLSESYKLVERKLGNDIGWLESMGVDSNKQYVILDHKENYESPYDEDFHPKKNHEEIERRNLENAIEVYRVYDILEKCRLYDIIDKYEELSYKTCIKCGRPAKYMSRGWISPYCEDCINPTGKYDKIEDVL